MKVHSLVGEMRVEGNFEYYQGLCGSLAPLKSLSLSLSVCLCVCARKCVRLSLPPPLSRVRGGGGDTGREVAFAGHSHAIATQNVINSKNLKNGRLVQYGTVPGYPVHLILRVFVSY